VEETMSRMEAMPLSEAVAWSIVGDRYISTAYRRSSAARAPNHWYYETFIWEYDPVTGKRGRILHCVTTDDVKRARKVHWQITESLAKLEE